jgi:DNA-binding MarR family transcriptional regulator
MHGSQRARPHPSEELGTLIARSRRRVWACAARHLERMGESIHTWQLLKHLRQRGPLAQCDLAAVCGQHPAGVSRMLEVLEGEGHVRRTRDPSDRRKVQVEITEAGLERLERMHPEVVTAADRALEPLSAEDRRALKALLEKLVLSDEAPRR